MDLNDLTVVIVSYKSKEKISKCLDSIPKKTSIFVIENSDDKIFKSEIEKKYSNVRCILTGDNKGYAVANNIGLREVKTKFSLILNPDTILDKNAIKNFLEDVKKVKNFWLMGPVNNQNENFKNVENDLLEVKNLKGFAFFLNMEKFEKDFFDENFFLYFEEIDLCKKVKNKGGKIYISKNIIINHESASSVKKDKIFELEKNRNWHWMWSTFYFHKKYKGFLIALVIIFPKLLSSLFKTIFFQLIFNKEKKDIYLNRLSGITNSILGKKSWRRPTID